MRHWCYRDCKTVRPRFLVRLNALLCHPQNCYFLVSLAGTVGFGTYGIKEIGIERADTRAVTSWPLRVAFKLLMSNQSSRSRDKGLTSLTIDLTVQRPPAARNLN